MPVTNKVSARVQFLYGDGSVEVIKVPADLIERDRCTCSEECPHHEGKPSFQLKGLP